MLGRTFIGEITGPSDFGTGLVNTPSENSGDPVGFSGSVRFVFVPDDYSFGTALSETSTYSGQSFSSLGLKPGSYVYSWGSGEHADTFTIDVVTSSVPEISTWTMMLVGLLGVGFAGWGSQGLPKRATSAA